MTSHETTIKSPGYALSVVQAVCTCGWRGPDRNAYDQLDRVRVQLDAAGHLETVERERAQRRATAVRARTTCEGEPS